MSHVQSFRISESCRITWCGKRQNFRDIEILKTIFHSFIVVNEVSDPNENGIKNHEAVKENPEKKFWNVEERTNEPMNSSFLESKLSGWNLRNKGRLFTWQV